MPPEVFSLTIEQSFALRKMADQIPDLPEQHCRELLVQMARQLMIKDNLLKHFIKQTAGVI